MLSVQNVNKHFGRLHVLRSVSLEAVPGKSYALIGPNGSGKTTLIKAILGMTLPQSGQILVNDKNVRADFSYRKQIGYMPQMGRYPANLTIGQLIDMMKNIRVDTVQTDEQLFEEFRLFQLFDKPMYTLSGGTRQKVSAALAFLFHAPVLILDEPTAGLDPVASEILREKILLEKKKGKLILITSHILSDLDELSSDLIYLHDGRVQYQNTVDALKHETGESRLIRAIATLIRQKEISQPAIT